MKDSSFLPGPGTLPWWMSITSYNRSNHGLHHMDHRRSLRRSSPCGETLPSHTRHKSFSSARCTCDWYRSLPALESRHVIRWLPVHLKWAAAGATVHVVLCSLLQDQHLLLSHPIPAGSLGFTVGSYCFQSKSPSSPDPALAAAPSPPPSSSSASSSPACTLLTEAFVRGARVPNLTGITYATKVRKFTPSQAILGWGPYRDAHRSCKSHAQDVEETCNLESIETRPGFSSRPCHYLLGSLMLSLSPEFGSLQAAFTEFPIFNPRP